MTLLGREGTRAASERPPLARTPGDVAFLALCAVAFLGAAAATVRLCAPMAASMPMRGGWTLGMTWMRTAGQSWPGAWAAFGGTWAVMMVAMMLPAVAPVLAAYGHSAGHDAAGDLARKLMAGAGYFLVWAVLGVALYPAGALLATAAMQSGSVARLLPVGAGMALVLAGFVQVSPWKGRQLARCQLESHSAGTAPAQSPPEDCCAPLVREPPAAPAPSVLDAGRDGVRLGLRCVFCCSGLMVALLALGAMDLRAMAAIGAAITTERLLPWPRQVARAAGGLLLALGVIALARVVA